MALATGRETMTQREREEFEQEKTFAEMQSAHNLKIKEMELEVAKLEARWSVLLRLPLEIVMLPVRMLLGLGYIVGSFREDYEPGENYWKFMGIKK
jgi:hypothetical protein